MAKKSDLPPTIDPTVLDLLAVTEAENISTAFSRAASLTPCPIGADGACCKMCGMGPCRLVGKTTRGVCGATLGTIAARNFARMVAAGASAHSDHGRDLAFTLIAVGKGEAEGYEIKDEAKLREVAGYLDIPTAGKSSSELAVEVGTLALEQFGQQFRPVFLFALVAHH